MLGLAISLVSTVPEKVWYCKVKGYKPWLKPKQQDVVDNEQGGHTTWYDEPALLKVCPAFQLVHTTTARNTNCVPDPSCGVCGSIGVCWAP